MGESDLKYFCDGGLYTPQSNNVSYIIEVTPLTTRHYKLDETGLKIELCTPTLKTGQ